MLTDGPARVSLPPGLDARVDTISRAAVAALDLPKDAPLVVFAWGHGGAQGATPVFHVRGPRVTPDDVQAVASWVLAHRLVLKPEAALDGDTDLGVVGAVLDATPVPR